MSAALSKQLEDKMEKRDEVEVNAEDETSSGVEAGGQDVVAESAVEVEAKSRIAKEKFLTDYKSEDSPLGYRAYEALAAAAKQLFEWKFGSAPYPSALPLPATKCLITARGKSVDSVEKTILRREAHRRERKPKSGFTSGPYRDVHDIRAEMPDLAGICIILVFPDDEEKITSFITQGSFVLEGAKYWGINQDGSLRTDQITGDVKKRRDRFVGYRALHYRVKMKKDLVETEPEPLRRRWAQAWNMLKKVDIENMDLEIQITSMAMYAWKEVHHDLVYKTYQGELTPAEVSTLDMVNGLVLANEVAINNFHQALEKRLEEIRLPFRDVDHLKHWLTVYFGEYFHSGYKKTSPPIQFGELLLRVLRIYELDTAEKFLELVKVRKQRLRLECAPSDHVLLRKKLGKKSPNSYHNRVTADRIPWPPTNEFDEGFTIRSALETVGLWRETLEQLLKAGPDFSKIDVSVWALLLVCEARCPFEATEDQESVKQFIILSAFAMRSNDILSCEPRPPNSPIFSAASEFSRKKSLLSQILQWSGQREGFVPGRSYGTGSEFYRAILRRDLENYLRWGDDALNVQVETVVGLSIALLSICPLPNCLQRDPPWNTSSAVLWPGTMNIRALAAYHDRTEYEIIAESVRLQWHNFLVIVDSKWEEYYFPHQGWDLEWEWIFVKTAVPSLLEQNLDFESISQSRPIASLRATGVKVRAEQPKRLWGPTVPAKLPWLLDGTEKLAGILPSESDSDSDSDSDFE